MQPLWLLDSIGSRLIIDEQQAFSDLSVSSLGNYFLQLGIWGRSNTFTHKTHIKNCFLIATHAFSEIDLVADLERLPLQDETIDVIFLPHTLEQYNNHQDILSASTNVVNESGTLIALGFNPVSLWGLRHWFSGKDFLPGIKRLISVNQYTRWLVDFGFGVEKIHYFHAIIPQRKRYEVPLKSDMFNPFLCACYMIIARKEMIPLTLEKQFIKDKRQKTSLADSMGRMTI